MTDVSARSKWVFWVWIAVAVGAVTVPSWELARQTDAYFKFLSGWNPGVIKPKEATRIPHRIPEASIEPQELNFVEFSLRAPRAKEVGLGADFNNWQAQTLPLARNSRGRWEITVPLPPGTYRYGFEIDGRWTQDPEASKQETLGDRAVSVKQVE